MRTSCEYRTNGDLIKHSGSDLDRFAKENKISFEKTSEVL